ncbi:diguanylate cyclase [Planctomycetota bacterium]
MQNVRLRDPEDMNLLGLLLQGVLESALGAPQQLDRAMAAEGTNTKPRNGRAAGLNDPVRRLLIVEDEKGLRGLVRRTFGDTFEVHEAGDGVAGLEAVKELRPEVVIADQRMPKMSGVELLTRVKEQLPLTVRILITGYDDYGPVVDALNAANVHHYFEKPFHMHDLRAVTEAMVRSCDLERQRDELLGKLQESVRELEQSNASLRNKEAELEELVQRRTQDLERRNEELRAANDQLSHLAVRDGLTGLFNHRYFVEHADLEIARSRRYKREFSLLFLDVDNFKRVNDQFGHQAGDAVLRRLGELLASQPHGLRQSDFSARYGGEEFCVLLPETPLDGARIKAERLREAVEAEDWSKLDPPAQGPLTVSIGVATFPDHGTTSRELLASADAALYEAKGSGKNKVCEATRGADS